MKPLKNTCTLRSSIIRANNIALLMCRFAGCANNIENTVRFLKRGPDPLSARSNELVNLRKWENKLRRLRNRICDGYFCGWVYRDIFTICDQAMSAIEPFDKEIDAAIREAKKRK